MALIKHQRFGDKTQYCEPAWYQGMPSPYYTQDHVDFRKKVRDWVEAEVLPYAAQWDEAGTYPPDMHDKAYKAGIYAAIWPVEYGGTPPKNFDIFHDLILMDELARCAVGGIFAVFFSFGIALPPVIHYGSQYLKDKVCRDVITGKAIMSLAISEPGAGSDVANIETTAVREGDYYIVNGSKKWITGGTKAKYFTVACRTGGKGYGGVSLLLMERDMPGFEIRRMKTQGWWLSGTAFLTFTDVKVPVKNLIGVENGGFLAIMHNFNHERYVLAATSNRYARVCLQEAMHYAQVRKTFGKRLVDHQVIQHKLMEMARMIESTQSWAEQLAYAMKHGDSNKLEGQIALFKVQATKTYEFCAREASQVMGGTSWLRGEDNKGHNVERLYREVRVNAIGGGSEEILLNMAFKRAKL